MFTNAEETASTWPYARPTNKMRVCTEERCMMIWLGFGKGVSRLMVDARWDGGEEGRGEEKSKIVIFLSKKD